MEEEEELDWSVEDSDDFFSVEDEEGGVLNQVKVEVIGSKAKEEEKEEKDVGAILEEIPSEELDLPIPKKKFGVAIERWLEESEDYIAESKKKKKKAPSELINSESISGLLEDDSEEFKIDSEEWKAVVRQKDPDPKDPGKHPLDISEEDLLELEELENEVGEEGTPYATPTPPHPHTPVPLSADAEQADRWRKLREEGKVPEHGMAVIPPSGVSSGMWSEGSLSSIGRGVVITTVPPLDLLSAKIEEGPILNTFRSTLSDDLIPGESSFSLSEAFAEVRKEVKKEEAKKESKKESKKEKKEEEEKDKKEEEKDKKEEGLRLLFLDVDGVLHSDELIAADMDDPRLFDNVCMTNLLTLIQRTGALIVLSSAWRCSPQRVARVVQELQAWGMSAPIGCTAQLGEHTEVCRAEEIGLFVKQLIEAGHKIDSWVALDDCNLSGPLSGDAGRELAAGHFVQTRGSKGLSASDVLRVRRLMVPEEAADKLGGFGFGGQKWSTVEDMENDMWKMLETAPSKEILEKGCGDARFAQFVAYDHLARTNSDG